MHAVPGTKVDARRRAGRAGRVARLTAVLALAAAAAMSAAGTAAAATSTVGPGAAWWQWASGLTTTQPCAGAPVDDHGRTYFFLAAVAEEQTCTVAAGQTVLVPAANVEWSATEAAVLSENGLPEGWPDYCASTVQRDLQRCASWQASLITEATVTLDGEPVETFLSMDRAFKVTWTPGAVFGVPAGTTRTAAVGYYAYLPELTPGDHELVVTYSFGDPIDFSFTSVTHLQVT